MKETWGPPLRAAAVTAFITGLILLLLNPPSLSGAGGLVSLLAGALAIVLVTAWLTVLALGRGMPAARLRKPEERSAGRAALAPPDQPPTELDELVMQALDELPQEFRDVLHTAPVVVSTRGR